MLRPQALWAVLNERLLVEPHIGKLVRTPLLRAFSVSLLNAVLLLCSQSSVCEIHSSPPGDKNLALQPHNHVSIPTSIL